MTSSHTLELTNAQSVPGTHLQGRRLFIARVIWVILVVLTLSLFAAMLPAYFTRIQTVCASPVCALGQPSPDAIQTLQAHGFTLVSYAVIAVVLTILVTVICVVVALLIIRRRSDDWIALLVALTLVVEGTTFVTYTLEFSHSAWQMPAFIMNSFSWGAIFLLFFLFPNGHFVPRWTRWLVIIWIGCNIAAITFPFLFAFTLLSDLTWLCLCACCMCAQIYRYRRVSSQIQRQQTKWIVYGTSMSIVVVIALEIPILCFPSFGPGSLYSLVSWYGFILALIPFPLSIGFAVHRSRLWDIDKIINRTLVYGLLTALLVLAYFGGVVLLQYLFRLFTGQASLLAVIGSTLAIAALFHPLRGYLQTTIDTRFNRRKYDISQVLASFDDTVRSCLYSYDEKSLQSLTDNVRRIVEETLQPSHISLWLYALELPKETGESAKEARHISQVTSTSEDQEEALQELYLQVSAKNRPEEQNSGDRYLQGIPLRRGYQRLFARVVSAMLLRNRLWNIDVLTNRTLIYGALIGVLALASTGILLIEQQLAQALPTQIAELFIVGSILALVMCFKPLRRHIQSFIDRHFYQPKYQAKQRLDDFTATLRHEVNLTQLSEGLLEVVSETMEPEAVSLWINKPEPESKAPRYTGVLRQ